MLRYVAVLYVIITPHFMATWQPCCIVAPGREQKRMANIIERNKVRRELDLVPSRRKLKYIPNNVSL